MGFIIIILVVVAIPLVYLASLNGDYEISRSIIIKKDASVIFQKIADLKSWINWSPWLIHEPETNIKYSENCNQIGGYYEWDGKLVGAGKMTHTLLQEPSKIEQKLEFIRPFKSVCQISWLLEKEESHIAKPATKVTWMMKGKMPFFFRFMIPKMIKSISKDYDFGLALLNGVVDQEAETPKVAFNGVVQLDSQKCLTKPYSGNFSGMKKAMELGFPEIFNYVEKAKLKITGFPLSIYHKMNPKKQTVVLDIAIPIAEASDESNYKVKEIEKDKYLKTTLKGSYQFLEMAWQVAFGHLKMKKYKFNWKKSALEIYPIDPRNVKHSNEIITEIYIPIK